MNDNQVFAKVEGREITRKDVEELLKNVDPKVVSQFNNPEGVKKLVSQLAQQELFYLDALEKGLDKEDVFTKEVERAKENLLKQYAINKFLSTASVSENEMKEYYEENKQEFKEPESIKASHILVKEESTAQKIISQLEEGTKFEDAAKEYSMCPSKEKGGDLGFFTRGKMVPEFENAAFALSKDEVSKEPVKTQFGYHIIKRTGRRDEMPLSFEEVRNKLQSQLVSKKQEKLYFGKIEELKNKYDFKLFI
ncbi:UNVERIFIED_CONTAM: peptidyl-prolyl cis-trans isomerase C [Acetivibrio alkalicellulosi]